ncbi:hypothetical protein [Pseudoduganella chitinolytica]|uniref:Uncharacterized protein n=1 Tax=Pseudoduganella chitinolytica TaxID=34070 RepID=A0ABY8BII1_9BURK|nr:hypothetical protein [Pseudoduganella chitinolytica]WEF35650.1 hypothetical protein PX653_13160 [Pseudoduganella chitinolytica]
MRRFPGQALRIGIAASAVSLLRTSRWRGDKVAVLADYTLPEGEPDFASAAGATLLAQALRTLLEGQDVAGWPVAVVLGDELCRVWQVSPPPGAARLADIEAAAALRFHALYGEAPAAWALSADWDAKQPFHAAALPRALLAVLQALADDKGFHLVEIVPHFVTGWNRWQRALRAGSWFGQWHDRMLTLAAIDGQGLRAIRAVPVPPGADHYWLTQVVQREALLLGLEPPAQVQLAGALPPALARPAQPGQVACSQLGAGQGTGMSAAGQLACAGSAA